MKQESFKFGKYLTNQSNGWADPEIIKKHLAEIDIFADNYPGAGTPIISNSSSSKAWVDDSERHTLYLGSTGSGKSRWFAMPTIHFLGSRGESFAAIDMKGELYAQTSGLLASKGYDIKVINLRDMKKSCLFNPLTQIHELYHSGKTEQSTARLNDLIATLGEDQKRSTKDQYWILSSSMMSLAYFLIFIATSSRKQANLLNFANFFAQNSTPEDAERLAKYVADGSIASINLKNILTNKDAKSTFGNIASGVSNMIAPFIYQKTLGQVLSQSEIDITKLGDSKTALFLIIPDEKDTYNSLTVLIIKQIYESLIERAQQQENKKLPVRVNLLLDEAFNLGTINGLPSMLTASRSRGIRMFLYAQGLDQIEQRYQKDSNTIIGNCENIVFLNSRELGLLDWISKLCGDISVAQLDGSEIARPLISIQQLQRLSKDKGEALMLIGRHEPLITQLPDIQKYGFKPYHPIELKERELPSIIP